MQRSLRRDRKDCWLPEEENVQDAAQQDAFALPTSRSNKMCSLFSELHDELTGIVHPIHQQQRDPSEGRLLELIARVRSNSRPAAGQSMDRQWRRVQLRCQTHPHEATMRDRRGRTCLGAACAKKPTLAALNSLIRVAHHHDEDKDVSLLHRDNHGRTPLAIAIDRNACLRVVTRLLEACPSAAQCKDNKGMLPLHIACFGYDNGREALVKLLLEVYPEGASVLHQCPADQWPLGDGRSPLQAALEGATSIQVIRMLVAAFPKGVITQFHGKSALCRAIGHHFSPVEVIRCMVQGYPEALYIREGSKGLPLRHAVAYQRSTDVLECLLGTEHRSAIVLDSILGDTVLSSAVTGRVPRESVVRLLVGEAPQAVNIPSKTGWTPLMLACKMYERMTHDGLSGIEVQWKIICVLLRAAQYGRLEVDDPMLHSAVARFVPLAIVTKIVHAYPEQIHMVDSAGNVPLLLALRGPRNDKSTIATSILEVQPSAAMYRDEHGRSVLSHAACALSMTPDVFRAVVHADPTALRQLDPIHSLYPFQMAALPRKPRLGPQLLRHPRPTHTETKEEDALQLSAILELLLAAPDLILSHFAH